MPDDRPTVVDDATWTARTEATRAHQRERLESAYRRAGIVEPRRGHRASASGVGASPLERVVAHLAAATAATAPAGVRTGAGRGDGVATVLAAAGLRSRPVELTGGWFRTPALAMLATVDGAPVALVPTRRGYDAVDADGSRRRVTASVAATVGGRAEEVFARLPEDRVAGVRDLLRVALAGERHGAWLVAGCAVVAAALGLLTPAVTGWVLGTLVPLGRDGLMAGVGVVLAVAAATSAALLVVQQRALSGIEQAAQLRAQVAVWDRVLSMPAPFFRRFSPGDLSVRVTAAQQLVNLVGAGLVSQVLAAALSLSSIVVMLRYDVTLGLIGAVMLVATLGALGLVLRRARPLAAATVEGQLDVTARSVETVLGIGTIRDASAEPRAVARMVERLVDYVASQAEMTRLSGVFAATVSAGSAVTSALLFLGVAALGWGPHGPSISSADYLGVTSAFGAAYGGLTALVVAVLPLMSVRPMLLLAHPVLESLPERSTGREAWVPAGGLELRHVSFRYSPESPDVLHDVSLRIEPGSFVALVGPSGAGKSTVLRLLLGFETPDEGQVLVDGRELRDLDPHVLRAGMGAVTQDAVLLGSSIRDTVAGQRRMADEDVWTALERAAVAEDVRAMPMGLDTQVTQAMVSGGQQQRLLLARALARSVRLVLLDEATSAMDDLSQAVVMAALDAMDATRVVVAHRLSTVRAADRIVVVDDGRIVEEGTYDELVARNGLFARLVARQLA